MVRLSIKTSGTKPIRQRSLYLKDNIWFIPAVCSRKEIADSTITGIDGPIYPGTCRGRSFSDGYPGARRIKTDNRLIEFKDALQGPVRHRLDSDIGDFVLRRADGIFAYQLAVVVDDAEQGVTHVVRGERFAEFHSSPDIPSTTAGLPDPILSASSGSG